MAEHQASDAGRISGDRVRAARRRLRLTQQQAARLWGMSQPYLSLVEQKRRRAPHHLARLLAREEPALRTALPLELPPTNDLAQLLGSLGYPGFAYLADPQLVANPAAVLLLALRRHDRPARVTRALPWLLATYADLDWDWALGEAQQSNVQNRLGYLVTLGQAVARTRGDARASAQLADAEARLEDARLAKEETLGRALTEAERRHLRLHRPAAAAHWNVLTLLGPEDLHDGV